MHLTNSKRWYDLFLLKGSNHINITFQFIALQRANRPNNVAIPVSFTKGQCDVDSAHSRGQATGAKESSLLSSMALPKDKKQQYLGSDQDK